MNLKIQFLNEDGIDYGGLTREWLSLIGKEAFNPNFGLWEVYGNQIQPFFMSKYLVPNDFYHFFCLGKIVGKVILENLNLDVSFCKSFLKQILRKKLLLNDLADIDQELYKNLLWILNNKITEDLEYNFVYTQNYLGKQKTFPLIENGEEIYVNEENKQTFVKLFCEKIMIRNIQEQTQAFIQGLDEIIPFQVLQILNEQELGLTLAGVPTVDINDMKNNTNYQNYYADSQVIVWFWDILEEENEVIRANFLFFLTGSFKVPYGGFKNFPLKIVKINCNTESLPVAHTCFNQIDLPEYNSKEKLKEKLLIAISEGQQGFHLG